MKFNLTKVGHWALVAGLALSVLAVFAAIPNVILYLFFLGLVVGFLNVREKESTAFLIAVVALLAIGVAGLQLGQLTPLVTAILNNFLAFVSAAALVVAIKQILASVQPNV